MARTNSARGAVVGVGNVGRTMLEGDLFQPIDSGHLHWNQVHELSAATRAGAGMQIPL